MLKNRILVRAGLLIIFLIFVCVVANLQQKSLWDVLELIVVPIVVVFVAYYLTAHEGKRAKEDAVRGERYQIERHFYDSVTNILLDRDLTGNEIGIPQKDIIFARTMSTLRRLNELEGDSHIKTIMDFMRDSTAFQADQTLLSRIVDACKNENISIPKQLIDAKLQSADLHEIDLSDWNLGGSVLSSANLRDSNLSGAYLAGTVLANANLSGANLRGANLDRAIIFDARLDGVLWDETTILPDGQNWSSSVDLTKYVDSEED